MLFEVPLPEKIINVVFGKDSETVDIVTDGFQCYLYSITTTTSCSNVTGRRVDTVELPRQNGFITAAFPFADRIRWILSASDGLYIFNRQTKTVDTVYFTNSEPSNTYANYRGASWIGVSEDETQIYTSGKSEYTGDFPSRLCAWDSKTFKQIYQLDDTNTFSWKPVRNQRSTHIVFTRAMATSPTEVQGYLYDLRTGKEDRALPYVGPNGYSILSLSRDGKYLAYQAKDSTMYPVRFLSTETGKVLGQFMQGFNENLVIQFLFASTLDVFIPNAYLADGPCPFSQYGVRLRLEPPTGVPLAIEPNSQVLQCTVQPNPSEGGTVVTITLATPETVTVQLVATNGNVVLDNNLSLLEAGEHCIPVRASSGFYLCVIRAGARMQTLPVIFR